MISRDEWGLSFPDSCLTAEEKLTRLGPLLILQPFRHFTYVTAHSPTLPSLYLRHSSFSNTSVASPTSQLILQPFRCFTYVTVHSPTIPLLHLRHSSFFNPSFASPTSQVSFFNLSVASPTSQLILQSFFLFSYVTAHSPTHLSLLLRHSSFSNPSFASPTTQLILQPFFRFSYVTAHSPTHLSLLLRHKLFTYVTWRAAHVISLRFILEASVTDFNI